MLIRECFVFWNPNLAITQYVTLKFNKSATASVLWNSPFPANTSYVVLVNPATVTDGGPPITVVEDGSAHTNQGVRLIATAPFTGTVEIIGFWANVLPYPAPPLS